MTKRQAKILEILREQKRTSVARLSEIFEMTEASIRTDLTDLENAGLIHRFHGGARIVAPSAFETRLNANLANKKKIVEKAITHIQAGETLYLDSGTTVLLLARELSRVGDVTVVTNSPPVVSHLGPETEKKVILIGGEWSYEDQCCFGQMTEKNLADIYVSKVFMGADSIDIETGTVFAHLRNLSYIGKIIRNAKQTILLADSSKFNRIRGMKIVDLSDIHVIITDAGLPADQQERIRNLGISLETAE
jgi:DeoR family transcriptional regulator, fructose operon transcriptional repressor